MKIYKRFFFLCGLFLLGCTNPKETRPSNAEELFLLIPSKEKESLAKFLSAASVNGTFLYTFFGSKPVSILSSPHQNMGAAVIYFGTGESYSILEEGWKAWEKNKLYFKNKNFFLRRILTEKSVTYFLINKKNTIKLLEKHLETFCSLLQETVTVNEIFSRILQDDLFLGKILHCDGCLGMLLGFGKNNALLFKRRSDLRFTISQKQLPPLVDQENREFLSPLSKRTVDSYTVSNKGGREVVPYSENIYTELRDIEENFLLFDEKGFFLSSALFKFCVPSFIAIKDDPETLLLKKRYKEDEEKIAGKLEGRTVFCTILSLLLNEEEVQKAV